jgi:hypothetical protein
MVVGVGRSSAASYKNKYYFKKENNLTYFDK